MKNTSKKLQCVAVSPSWREGSIVWVVFLFLSFSFLSQKTIAQSACPTLTVSPNVSICNGCTPLSATVQGSVATTSYSVSTTAYSPLSYTTGTSVLVNIDDTWSNAITIPFCFQF